MSMIEYATPAGVVKKAGNVRIISPLEITLAFQRLNGHREQPLDTPKR
jgi:hypothetical protein